MPRRITKQPLSATALQYCQLPMPHCYEFGVERLGVYRTREAGRPSLALSSLPVLSPSTIHNNRVTSVRTVESQENWQTVTIENASAAQLAGMRAMLEKHKQVFLGPDDQVRVSRLPAGRWTMRSEATHRFIPQRRLAPTTAEVIEGMVQRGLDAGIYELSDAPTNNQIVPVIKPSGAVRLTVAMTGPNRFMEYAPRLAPTPVEVRRFMSGKRYFIQLDMKDAFHQMQLSEEVRVNNV